jgi:hypothetical protein
MRMLKRLLTLGLSIVFMTALARPAQADPVPVITFVGFFGGTISYAGGTAPLVGTNIGINLLYALNTPLNDGVRLTVRNTRLNFTTGTASNVGGYSWDAGPSNGNYFTIMGDIPALGLVGETLLSGGFGTASVDNGNTLAISLGADSKHPAILAYYGLDPDTIFKFSGSTHLVTPPTVGAFSSQAASIIVSNYAIPVPEPAALLLLGIVFLGSGLVVFGRL